MSKIHEQRIFHPLTFFNLEFSLILEPGSKRVFFIFIKKLHALFIKSVRPFLLSCHINDY